MMVPAAAILKHHEEEGGLVFYVTPKVAVFCWWRQGCLAYPDEAVRLEAARDKRPERQLSPLGQIGQHSHFRPWGCRDFRPH